MLARRKMTIICLITIFFVMSACINTYARQLSFLDMMSDTDEIGSVEAYGSFAMCVPPDTDSGERNEKLANAGDLYIRINRADSMIFSNGINLIEYTDVGNNQDKYIYINEGESLTGQVIMRC